MQCQHILSHLQQQEDITVLSLLQSALAELEQASSSDKRLHAIGTLLGHATIEIEEATTDLAHYVEQCEVDPQHLAALDKRLEQLHTIARKHHINPPELPAHFEKLQQKLKKLNATHTQDDALKSELAKWTDTYKEATAQLSQARQKTAKRLSKTITQQLPQLGMTGVNLM